MVSLKRGDNEAPENAGWHPIIDGPDTGLPHQSAPGRSKMRSFIIQIAPPCACFLIRCSPYIYSLIHSYDLNLAGSGGVGSGFSERGRRELFRRYMGEVGNLWVMEQERSGYPDFRSPSLSKVNSGCSPMALDGRKQSGMASFEVQWNGVLCHARRRPAGDWPGIGYS